VSHCTKGFMSPVLHLSWMDKTFTSRAKTEELLRPELDNSLLPSDFEKAVDFLPSSQRRWQVRVSLFSISANPLNVRQVACVIAAGSVVSGYGIFLRKPPWSLARVSIWGGLAGVGGSMVGQFMRGRAHAEFFHSLQDRDGFVRSLSNVRTRLGGAGSMRTDIVEAKAQEAIGSPAGAQNGSELTCGSSRTY